MIVKKVPYHGLTWREFLNQVWRYRAVKGELLSAFPYLRETAELKAFEDASQEFQRLIPQSTMEDLKPKALKIHEALRALMALCEEP